MRAGDKYHDDCTSWQSTKTTTILIYRNIGIVYTRLIFFTTFDTVSLQGNQIHFVKGMAQYATLANFELYRFYNI